MIQVAAFGFGVLATSDESKAWPADMHRQDL